jgi:hypothetical protein
MDARGRLYSIIVSLPDEWGATARQQLLRGRSYVLVSDAHLLLLGAHDTRCDSKHQSSPVVPP